MKPSHLLLVFVPMLVASCKDPSSTDLTTAEAQQAVDEASVSSQASNLTSSTIEIATNFTIGQAAQNAVNELKTFYASELPCADVTIADSTLTIQYGAKPGNCSYKGQTFTGTQSVTIQRDDNSDVEVHHQWQNVSNGVVSVTGTADVTWSFAQKDRHVVHDLTWTRLRDGRTGEGTGDKTQTALEGGIAEGFREDGNQTWTGQSGQWDLSIEGVEMRWVDPVPQAGTYHLATPNDKSLSLSFSRVDDTTIRVTVTNGDKSFSFNVTKLGSIS